MEASGLTQPSVLLVDDVEANLVALEAHLDSLDCEVVRAGSGNDALRQLLKREFAVMLLDVQMPGMDGFEVARLARGDPATSEVPIIFVTAMPETEGTVVRGYGSGVVDLLFKPINPDVLRSKVRVFLELHQGRRRLALEIAAHQKTMAELEAFNYSVWHDLRAPLRPIEGFSRELLETHGAALDASARESLRRIQAAAGRMSQLIDDLLQLSRIRRAKPRRQPVDLGQLAQTAFAQLRAAQPERDAALTVEPASALHTEGDPGLLLIALENLIGNAWKFTGKKPQALIELGVTETARGPAYFVRDNGAGFDPAYASKLFAPFRRLHTASEFPGTGIGLAIVERVIAHHGGQVWAESKPDEGATIFFTLDRPLTPAR